MLLCLLNHLNSFPLVNQTRGIFGPYAAPLNGAVHWQKRREIVVYNTAEDLLSLHRGTVHAGRMSGTAWALEVQNAWNALEIASHITEGGVIYRLLLPLNEIGLTTKVVAILRLLTHRTNRILKNKEYWTKYLLCYPHFLCLWSTLLIWKFKKIALFSNSLHRWN